MTGDGFLIAKSSFTEPLDDDEDMTELVDATVPRVDLVKGPAHGLSFLIAKASMSEPADSEPAVTKEESPVEVPITKSNLDRMPTAALVKALPTAGELQDDVRRELAMRTLRRMVEDRQKSRPAPVRKAKAPDLTASSTADLLRLACGPDADQRAAALQEIGVRALAAKVDGTPPPEIDEPGDQAGLAKTAAEIRKAL